MQRWVEYVSSEKYWLKFASSGGYSKLLDISKRIAILARERCVVGVTSGERVAGEVICEVAEVNIIRSL